MNGTGTQDGFIMKPKDQRLHTKGRYDILTSRLKNRERQRRYRARKRLESEVKKSHVANETPMVQVQVQPNVVNSCFVTRVYCKRKWKKDARKSHISQNEVIPSGSVATCWKITVDHFAPCTERKDNVSLEKEVQSGSSFGVCDSETPKVAYGGRNWKSEARKKKI